MSISSISQRVFLPSIAKHRCPNRWTEPYYLSRISPLHPTVFHTAKNLLPYILLECRERLSVSGLQDWNGYQYSANLMISPLIQLSSVEFTS